MSETAHFRASTARQESDTVESVAMEIAADFARLLERYPEGVREAARKLLIEKLSRAGAAEPRVILGTVLQLFEKRREWSVEGLRAAVAERGITAPQKALYNALAHLSRRGQIRNVGYGRYILPEHGLMMETTCGMRTEPGRANEGGHENP